MVGWGVYRPTRNWQPTKSRTIHPLKFRHVPPRALKNITLPTFLAFPKRAKASNFIPLYSVSFLNVYIRIILFYFHFNISEFWGLIIYIYIDEISPRTDISSCEIFRAKIYLDGELPLQNPVLDSHSPEGISRATRYVYTRPRIYSFGINTSRKTHTLLSRFGRVTV